MRRVEAVDDVDRVHARNSLVTGERWALAVALLLVAGLQYGLAIHSLRDLARRPSVRGNNKVAWGLVILALPFLGALLYGALGPTSFLPRANRPLPPAVSMLDENDLK